MHFQHVANPLRKFIVHLLQLFVFHFCRHMTGNFFVTQGQGFITQIG
ncbi:Uncharacterised protein [Vibrio cholerae]|nr:Uncharacterised protein [Vibrio cholerae]CSC54804.1 Uncharacterised protein [Vibrio cholerae]CSI50198.1 Uncharacterised protein [Vibrio cholerae]